MSFGKIALARFGLLPQLLSCRRVGALQIREPRLVLFVVSLIAAANLLLQLLRPVFARLRRLFQSGLPVLIKHLNPLFGFCLDPLDFPRMTCLRFLHASIVNAPGVFQRMSDRSGQQSRFMFANKVSRNDKRQHSQNGESRLFRGRCAGNSEKMRGLEERRSRSSEQGNPEP